jgi:HAMP domain-containing protein
VSCHHLSFSAGDADWQLWVDAGDDPLLKMIAITYTSAPESPTYRAVIERWDLSPRFAAGTFDATIPAGIEMIPLMTPQSEVRRLEDELQELRDDNRRVEEYVAAQKTIDLYSQIADRPEAAQRIETEKAKLAEIGDVSQDEIDAYLQRKRDLERELNLARRAARGS